MSDPIVIKEAIKPTTIIQEFSYQGPPLEISGPIDSMLVVFLKPVWLVPSSSPSTWASAVAAIDSIISARTMNGFDLVGDPSDNSVQSQSTKSLGEFLGLPIAPPNAAARRSAKRPRALVAGKERSRRRRGCAARGRRGRSWQRRRIIYKCI